MAVHRLRGGVLCWVRARLSCLVAACVVSAALGGCGSDGGPRTLRFATFNVGDLRTTDLRDAQSVRATKLAEVVQRLRPDVLLLTNITRDTRGVAGTSSTDPEGLNAERFEQVFLTQPLAEGVEPLEYWCFMPRVNSGRYSGRDLNGDGSVTVMHPEPLVSGADGSPPAPNPRAAEYALDAWGYGEYPGQRGLAVLVRRGLEPRAEDVRTFTGFQWASMPDASRPTDARRGFGDFYPFETWLEIPLMQSSAVLLPIEGRVDEDGEATEVDRVWVACLYAGPTVGDGPELRSTLRRRDEVRFLRDVVGGASYALDDNLEPVPSGVGPGPVVVLADLGVDDLQSPREGNPAAALVGDDRFAGSPVPAAQDRNPALAPRETGRGGGRLDYVLVGSGLEAVSSGVYRTLPSDSVAFPSPRFPVWVDVEIGD
ncbi:MAG: endonuclease/exonuclease/phosphatase family protein [Planctomycetota bacterium]